MRKRFSIKKIVKNISFLSVLRRFQVSLALSPADHVNGLVLGRRGHASQDTTSTLDLFQDLLGYMSA